jgi:hypothetical protein
MYWYILQGHEMVCTVYDFLVDLVLHFSFLKGTSVHILRISE